MAIELPELPYAKNALEPHISAETLEFHHNKHHKTYVDTLNKLISSSELEGLPLEEIVKKSSGKIFNNAGQAWNHNFYWLCLSPNGGGTPQDALGEAIVKQFHSFEEFKKVFSESAVANFGSGWTWLVKNKTDNTLAIVNTSNAGTPLTDAGVVPLLTLDVWEHAYYIDYRNARAKYIEGFWNVVNWNFANQNFGA